MEFDLIQKYLVTKDFHEGVEATFLSKPRRKPHWEPPHIYDISDEEIDQLYFTESSPNLLTLPSTLDLRQYPYSRFSLPTEKEVRLAVTGEGPEFRVEGRLKEKDEIISWFKNGHKGKWGIEEKVQDIINRKTVATEEEGLVWNPHL
jgi:3-hydroxyisobutyryl-CoA hydrolase